MTFGTETYRSNGSVVMTGANKAGIFVEVLTIVYSSASGSKVYTQIPAGSMYTILVQSGGQFSISVTDDGLGHAKIVWTKAANGSPYLNSAQDTRVLVFAKKFNQTDTYGMLLYNDDGDQLNDWNYPVPQYVTTLQPSATPVVTTYCAGNNTVMRRDHTAVLNVRPQTNRIIVVNLPDSTSQDVWYSCTSFVQAGAINVNDNSNNITITLTIVHPAGLHYQVPTLHVFALDAPITGGGTYGEQYFKPDGTLVYDSSAENVTISDTRSISYGGVQSYSMTLPSVPGVAVPFYEQQNYVSYSSPDINGNNGYWSVMRGLMQRKGSTIYTKFYEINEDPTSVTGAFNSQSGLSSNFTMVVDVSQLSPNSIAATPLTFS